MTTVIENGRLPNGGLIRLQRRRGAYDVIRNDVGLATTWHYVIKGVSADTARMTFDTMRQQQ